MAHRVTLANSIIGVGILAMPFCFQKCGIILAIVLLIISNWITRVCCHYLIKSSLLTRRKSFEFLGFHAFGSSGKLLVELCIIGYLIGTCITYFVVVGDLGPQIITKMYAFKNEQSHLRIYFMIAVTLFCILPLGMLKNVDSLSTVCTASIGFYICLIFKIVLESEEHILANDWTGKVVYWQPAGVLQCLPIFSMALSCQMQLFEVFKSINNQSVEKLNGIVRDATWICTVVYIAVGFFGYVAFCTQNFSGNILMNFSPNFGSDIIKIGFILSVAFSFPLVIFPCRASIYSLLYRKGHMDGTGGYIPEPRFKVITVFIVGFALCVALVIPSVELIIGLVGSTIGVAICVMFPAACFKKITNKQSSDGIYSLANFIFFGGFCLMVLGTYANLQAIDEQRSRTPLNNLHLPNPTDIPIIKEEILHLLNEKVTNLENEIEIKENPKLPQEEVKKFVENPRPNINLKKNENEMDEVVIRNKIVPEIPISQSQIMPIDERHNIDNKLKEEQLNESNNVIKEKDLINENVNPLPNIEIPNQPVLSSSVTVLPIKPVLSESLNTPQQTIDKDAIKNNEEIAAEEQKNNKDQKMKATEDELKKTQNELKKTKELLERKVDEIKEELFKQNKETQDLVVEKLEEVVEKVQKIEREVKKKDVAIKNEAELSPSLSTPLSSIPKSNDDDKLQSDIIKLPEVEQSNINRPTLYDKLANAAIPKANIRNVSQVYEPLSYKTGELIEHVRNLDKSNKLLPLPLAVLINSLNNKTTQAPILLDVKKEPSQPQIVQLPIEERRESMKSLPTPERSDLIKANATKSEQLNIEKNELKKTSEKMDNVEAIRRDILGLVQDNMITTTLVNNDLSNAHERIKRELDMNSPDMQNAENHLVTKNCLKEPNIDILLTQNSVVQFKAIGRELKSIQEKDNEP